MAFWSGLITRQVLEKAVFHGLTRRTVAEFMNTDVAHVGPGASLVEIQTHLVERHQRILPVVDNGNVLGVITRRDLLDFMLEEQNGARRLGEAALTHWSKRKNLQSLLAEQLPKEIILILREFGELAENMDSGPTRWAASCAICFCGAPISILTSFWRETP